VPYTKKEVYYNRAELDGHVKEDYHSRKAQLKRAYVIDHGEGKGTCTLGARECASSDDFISHVESAHGEQLAI